MSAKRHKRTKSVRRPSLRRARCLPTTSHRAGGRLRRPHAAPAPRGGTRWRLIRPPTAPRERVHCPLRYPVGAERCRRNVVAQFYTNIRHRDWGRRTDDLDKGNCTRDHRANLKSRCDSRRPVVARVDFSLVSLCVLCSAGRASSGSFRSSVPRSREATRQ